MTYSLLLNPTIQTIRRGPSRQIHSAPATKQHLKQQSGFTVIELLATLVILGIVFTAAVPAGRHFLMQNRTQAHITMLLGELNYARNTAILQNQNIIICPSADHKSCGSTWRDNHIVLNADGKIIRIFDPLPSKDKLIWKSSGVAKKALKMSAGSRSIS